MSNLENDKALLAAFEGMIELASFSLDSLTGSAAETAEQEIAAAKKIANRIWLRLHADEAQQGAALDPGQVAGEWVQRARIELGLGVGL